MTRLTRAALAAGQAAAQTVRIAEHRQPRIDAPEAVSPGIEARTGVAVEVVEYPGPDREYLSKLLTELAAGSGPDVFSLPNVSDLAEFSAAGCLAPVTEAVEGWDGWEQGLPVARALATSPDGEVYVMPSLLSVQQIYVRRDLPEAAGVPTEQPATWDDLPERAREAMDATGASSLMLPMGVTWGGGAFGEGFLMLAGGSDPQPVTPDGTLDLTGAGVREVMGLYETLVAEEMLPVDPLLGPEPWVIPKHQMAPAGELLITTCGSWCCGGDRGPESRNPIPGVEQAVGAWKVPGCELGRESVLATITHPFAVSANAVDVDVEAATQALLELGSVETQVSYTRQDGNLPPRADAAGSPGFQAMTALVPTLARLDGASTVESAPGFTAVSERVARATEALLLGDADAAGAQEILVDDVRSTLGNDAVQWAPGEPSPPRPRGQDLDDPSPLPAWERRAARRRVLLVLPSALMLAAFVICPSLQGVASSLSNRGLTGPTAPRRGASALTRELPADGDHRGQRLARGELRHDPGDLGPVGHPRGGR